MKTGEYVWDDQMTLEFLSLYRDNLDRIRDPNQRNKDVYAKILSDMLEKYPSEPLTVQLLTKKFFNLKRTHEKILLKKCSVENYDVQWKFFDIMTKLLSSSSSNEVVIELTKTDSSFRCEYAWKDNVTFEFLDLYLQRIEEFKNPKIRNKSIFASIANSLKMSFPDLPLTESIVQKKFYNMKRTYLDIVQKRSINKKHPINWKFFNKVHAIMSLTEQIKVEYVSYDFEENEGDIEEPSSKKFKSTTKVEDINFEDYVEYSNVEYDEDEKHDLVEIENQEELEDDIVNEDVGDLEAKFDAPEEEVIDFQMDEEEGTSFDGDRHEEYDELQNSAEQSANIFTICGEGMETTKEELTPYMKAKLDIEAKKIVLLEKIYNTQTERTDIDRDTLRVQKENNELLRKLLKVMSNNGVKK